MDMRIMKKGVFAERLKSARTIRDITQTRLAELADMNATMIAHFEGGVRLPSFDSLWRIGAALDVSIDYLMGTGDQPLPVRTGIINDSLALLSREDCDLVLKLIDFLRNRKQKNNQIKE
jgi:transcriptional regulator with XRE-family HTH domain